MDEAIFILIGLALVVLIVVGPIVALVRTRRLRRDAATKTEVAQLTRRVFDLSEAVKRLEAVLGQPQAAKPTPVAEVSPQRAPEPKPPTEPVLPTVAIPAPTKATPPLSRPPTHTVVAQPAPTAETRPPWFTPFWKSGSKSAGGDAAASIAGTERLASLEERLGANWLNKIGIVVLVIGVALFLSYVMRNVGPAGKIAVAYAAGAALVGLGVVGERKETYKVAARAVLGGGWAIIYFTTYAMHNVTAVRVVESATLGFFLLFLAAVAMVAHSLRYNSEVATGFAYLLGFVTVAVSQMTVGTLVASAGLAASLVVVLWRRRWYAIEPFAIVACYAVHWLWLRQVFEALGGHKPFPEFPASAALLTFYWAVWMASFFLREERDAAAQRLLTTSFLLNAAGYLAMLHYQSLYPHLRFWFLLGAGVTYLALSPLGKRLGRRLAFVLTSTVGAVLLVAAIPYRYSGARLEIVWLVQAEAFLVVGWRLAESHLRKLGWAAAGALTMYVTLHDLSPRLYDWNPPDTAMGLMLLTLAAGFYLNACLAPRLLREQAVETDTASATASYAVATGWLLAAVWLAVSHIWVGLVWVALALTLGEIGRRWNDAMLRGCGHGTALLAALRLLTINLQIAPEFYGVSTRALTVGAGVALFYLAWRRIALPNPVATGESARWQRLAHWGGLPAVYSWSASLLLMLLLWNELTNTAVGLGWALAGVALVELSRTSSRVARGQPDRPLAMQGHALLVLSFARIFFVDLNAEQEIAHVSARLITVSLLAAIYYYQAFSAPLERSRMRTAFFWFGTAAAASLLRFELGIAWVAVAWAAMVVVLEVGGRRLVIATLRQQACLLTLLVGMRCALDNFYQTGAWRFTNLRTVTVTLAALLLYAPLALALREKRGRSQDHAEVSGRLAPIRRAWRWLNANPRLLFFFVPTLLLTVLLSLEVRRGYLTAAWGVEALIVFAATLKLGERSYRWFSLALLLLCVGRIVTVDVWALDPLGRIFSFLALGAALLLVSYLYARYRELLRRYL